MRAVIYCYEYDPHYVVFDRALQTALVSTNWGEWQPVAVIEGGFEVENHPEAKAHEVAEFVLTVFAENKEFPYSAQQVLFGDAGDSVTFLWRE